MNDSFSPVTGPHPDAGDDLDRLLSNGGDYLSDPLAQVARTLDALRAAPLPAELKGEDAARAVFRAAFAAAPDTAAHDTAPLPAPAPWLAAPAAAAEAGRAHVLPGRHRRPAPSRRGPSPAGRPHAGRPALVRRPVMLLAAAAVTVVVAGGTALAVTLPGFTGHHVPAAGGVTATGTATISLSAPGGVDGNGTLEPTPASTGKLPSPRQLCDEFFGNEGEGRGLGLGQGRGQGQGQAPDAAQQADFARLYQLAQGYGSVTAYCMQVREPWAKRQDGGFRGLPVYQGANAEGHQNGRGNGQN